MYWNLNNIALISYFSTNIILAFSKRTIWKNWILHKTISIIMTDTTHKMSKPSTKQILELQKDASILRMVKSDKKNNRVHNLRTYLST